GEHGALRLKDGAADDIFRCDQFDIVTLAAEFEPYRLGNFRIALAERAGEEILIDRLDLVTCWHVLGFACFRTAWRRFPTAKSSNRRVSADKNSSPGDTPRSAAIPAEPARTCDISADNAAIFRGQRAPAATRQGDQSLVVAGMAGAPNP